VTDSSRRGGLVVLLDIEGTTTPIAFVYGTLFPLARARLAGWCERHIGTDEYRQVLAQLVGEYAADCRNGEPVPSWHDDTNGARSASMQAYVQWLMDRDRKSPGLKLLQGLIWEEAYAAGIVRGDVYPDVGTALRRWQAAGVRTAIYSSGSELAQRRLFQSTPAGDLSRFIAGFFDTAVGPKQSSASYGAIADRLGVEPGDVVFISDVTAELAAARRAGCRAILCVRPGNPPQPDAGEYGQIASFDELDPQGL
jgi:enolase-phosphatase E1